MSEKFNFGKPAEDYGNYDLDAVQIESFAQKYNYLKATKAREFEAKVIDVEEAVEFGTMVDVILVMTPPKPSREYYDQAWVEGTAAKAKCFSSDGLKPNARVYEPMSQNCQNCPKAQFGSFNRDGKVGTACRQKRKFICKFPGKDGWYIFTLNPASLKNFTEYHKLLASKDTTIYKIVTRMKFAKKLNYPLVEFEAIGYVAKDDFTAIADFLKTPEWKDMLGLNEQAAPAKVAHTEQPAEKPADTSFDFAAKPNYDDEEPKKAKGSSAIDAAFDASIPSDF